MLNLLALFMANKHLDAKAIKPYINPSFIRDLFRQLHHPDERIREGIKTIIHQFYVQFVGHRTFIRRNIRDQLLTFIYEDDTYRGTPHLLQVMGSIVRGYSTPLKNEHKLFLVKVLLPLHASPKFTDFSSNMSFLMVHFAQKDPSLSSVILSAVLRLWPLANTPKELELLEEVEEILSFCEPEVFSQVCNDLFKRLGKCMGSQHYQVANALFRQIVLYSDLSDLVLTWLKFRWPSAAYISWTKHTFLDWLKKTLSWRSLLLYRSLFRDWFCLAYLHKKIIFLKPVKDSFNSLEPLDRSTRLQFTSFSNGNRRRSFHNHRLRVWYGLWAIGWYRRSAINGAKNDRDGNGKSFWFEK